MSKKKSATAPPPRRETLPPQRSFQREFLLAALLILLTLTAFARSLTCGFIWDDNTLVTADPRVTSPDFWHGLASLWTGANSQDYFPLTSTSFWLEWHVWGAWAPGFHAVNVLLHTISVLLLWRILKALHIKGAWVAAALFAIHPITVESVAWIAERKNTLSLVFFLLTVWLYLRFLRRGSDPAWLLYAAAAGCFVLALCSKTSVVMLPFVLLLLIWWDKKTLTPRSIVQTIPFFFVAGVLGLITIHFQSGQGLDPATLQRGIPERIAQAGIDLWFYLYKTLLPLDLATVYPEIRITQLSALLFIPVLGWLALLAFLFSQRKKSWGPGTLLAVIFFTINLLPVLGLLNMAWTVIGPAADHFLYLPMIGILALIAALAAHAYQRTTPLLRRALAVTGIFMAALLLTLTILQIGVYQTNLGLWAYNVQVRPASAAAHVNYGLLLQDQGRIPEAVAQWEIGLQLGPNNYIAAYKLGRVYLNAGRYALAADRFSASLQIHPNYQDAQLGLAESLWRNGELAAAEKLYQQIIQGAPQRAETWVAYGAMLENAHRLADARHAYEHAIALDPALVAAHYDLGNCLQQQGDLPAAITAYQSALALDPKRAEVWFNLALALHGVGRDPDAKAALRQALALNPNLARLGQRPQ